MVAVSLSSLTLSQKLESDFPHGGQTCGKTQLSVCVCDGDRDRQDQGAGWAEAAGGLSLWPPGLRQEDALAGAPGKPGSAWELPCS